MRDPRYDPYSDAELIDGFVAEFGDPMLPPTHPDGPRKQVPLCQQCNHPTTGGWHVGPSTVAPGCDCCSWRQNDPAHVPPDRTPPLRAAPAGWSPEKWASMSRRERRAAEQAAKRRSR